MSAEPVLFAPAAENTLGEVVRSPLPLDDFDPDDTGPITSMIEPVAAGKISPLDWEEESADLCWEACSRDGYRAELVTRRGTWEVFMCAEHAAALEDVARRRGEHRPGQPGEPWAKIA